MLRTRLESLQASPTGIAVPYRVVFLNGGAQAQRSPDIEIGKRKKALSDQQSLLRWLNWQLISRDETYRADVRELTDGWQELGSTSVFSGTPREYIRKRNAKEAYAGYSGLKAIGFDQVREKLREIQRLYCQGASMRWFQSPVEEIEVLPELGPFFRTQNAIAAVCASCSRY